MSSTITAFPAPDCSDHGEGLGSVGLVGGSSLVYERHVGTQVAGILLGSLHPSRVRGNDGGGALQSISQILGDDGKGGQMVDRLAGEALYLAGMKIDRNDPVSPGRLEEITDQPRRDRLARQHFLVRSRITEERHHRCDAVRRRSPECLDEDELLHDVEIDLWCMTLHDETVGPAHRLQGPGIYLGVGKPQHLDPSQRDFELSGDRIRQLRIGRPGEQHETLAVREPHWSAALVSGPGGGWCIRESPVGRPARSPRRPPLRSW